MSIHIRKFLALVLASAAFALALRADANVNFHSAAEWAGAYVFQDRNSTGFLRLVVTPEGRFILVGVGCFGSYWINHGNVAYRDGTLHLDPAVPLETGSMFDSTALIPIRWDERLYLVEAERVGEFARTTKGSPSTCDHYCPGFFVRESDRE